MNLFKVRFHELYERHLCRHSQYGINVNHLLSVIGSYLALFAIAFHLLNEPWVWMPIPVLYLVLLAFNVPLRVLGATLAFLAGFFALFFSFSAPSIPLWASALLFVLSHYVQQWGHKFYTTEWDMSAFKQKYRKGFLLFVILSLYELPLLLNYLVFDTRCWFASTAAPNRALYPAQETGDGRAGAREEQVCDPVGQAS